MNTFIVVKELENGYIIMAPDGETGYITEETYQKLKIQNKIQINEIHLWDNKGI